MDPRWKEEVAELVRTRTAVQVRTHHAKMVRCGPSGMLFQKGALPTPIPYDSEPIKKPHHPPKPKSVAAKKYRNFLFSLMNYQSKPLTVDMLDSVDCKYIEYAMETPTTMYRLHDSLQGLITFKNPHGLNAVRSLLPGCGVIVCPDLQKPEAHHQFSQWPCC